MNRRKVFAQASSLLAIAGGIASLVGFYLILVKSLKLSEFSLSIASTLLAFLAGAYSTYLARFAKKLKLSPRVFLSYSHADEHVAREVAETLRNQGARVWLDQERIKPGESFHDAIEKGIDDADTFVVLLSGQPRSNLLLELGMAYAKGLRVIPVLLADAELPSDLRGLRYIDLRHERSRGLDELVRATT